MFVLTINLYPSCFILYHVYNVFKLTVTTKMCAP